MAGRITELTSAVNAYLNSISSTGASAVDTGNQLKGIFQKYFDKAVADIKIDTANIESEIKNNIDSHNYAEKAFQKTEAVDALSASASKSTAAKSSDSSNASANADVYKGLLGTDALKELSNSSYFYANMIQSSLFKSSDEEDENGNSSDSGFGETSINDLNTRSLLYNTLGITNDENEYTDYQKALLKAYQNNSLDTIFGEFLL
jgi:hypothetical protein